MSTRDVDRLLATWLSTDAPAREPDHLLEQVLGRTSRTRRRPGWRIPERWLSVQLTMRWRTSPSLTPILVVILLVLAIVAAVLVAGSTPRLPSPFGIAGNGVLVYGRDGALFLRSSIDGQERLLVPHTSTDFAPAFAPDGTRIAFLRMLPGEGDRMELWVARSDGSDAHRLAEFTTLEWFRWSPDGRVIAVTAGDETAPALSMVDVATGRVTPAERGSAVSQPTWRPPDGGQLLVRGHRGTSDAWGFRLLDRGGALVSHLELDEGFQDDPFYRENVWAYFLDPAWSPDGSTLAFTTLEPTMRDVDPGWRVHVVTVGRDGSTSGERILPADAALDDQYEARWLPDGSGLVTHVVDEDVHGLVLHRLDGSAPRDLGLVVPTLPGGDFSFVVSPDGTEVIAWSTKPVHAWRISLVDGSRRDIDLPAQEWPTWQRLAT